MSTIVLIYIKTFFTEKLTKKALYLTFSNIFLVFNTIHFLYFCDIIKEDFISERLVK